MGKPEKDKSDSQKTPPKKPEDDLHRPEKTLGDAPAGGPNPTERSRLDD